MILNVTRSSDSASLWTNTVYVPPFLSQGITSSSSVCLYICLSVCTSSLGLYICLSIILCVSMLQQMCCLKHLHFHLPYLQFALKIYDSQVTELLEKTLHICNYRYPPPIFQTEKRTGNVLVLALCWCKGRYGCVSHHFETLKTWSTFILRLKNVIRNNLAVAENALEETVGDSGYKINLNGYIAN